MHIQNMVIENECMLEFIERDTSDVDWLDEVYI